MNVRRNVPCQGKSSCDSSEKKGIREHWKERRAIVEETKCGKVTGRGIRKTTPRKCKTLQGLAPLLFKFIHNGVKVAQGELKCYKINSVPECLGENSGSTKY